MCEVSHGMDPETSTSQNSSAGAAGPGAPATANGSKPTSDDPKDLLKEPKNKNGAQDQEGGGHDANSGPHNGAVPNKAHVSLITNDHIDQVVDVDSCREAFKSFEKDDSGTIAKEVKKI